MRISAVILAAGNSQRFGSNKLLYHINQKPMVSYILNTVKHIDFDKVIVVTQYDEVENLAQSYGYTVVRNTNPNEGQSRSVSLGLSECLDSEGCMFFVADQPLLTEKTIREMMNLFSNNPQNIIIANYKGMNKNPVLFPKAVYTELLSLSGDVGGRIVIKNNPQRVLSYLISNYEEIDDIDFQN